MRITAACVDVWEQCRLSIEQHAPNCRAIYDNFHVMQHPNKAFDEVRRAEFFRKGARMRRLVAVEAIHGNINFLLRRGRGYKRIAATRTGFAAFKKAA